MAVGVRGFPHRVARNEVPHPAHRAGRKSHAHSAAAGLRPGADAVVRHGAVAAGAAGGRMM